MLDKIKGVVHSLHKEEGFTRVELEIEDNPIVKVYNKHMHPETLKSLHYGKSVYLCLNPKYPDEVQLIARKFY